MELELDSDLRKQFETEEEYQFPPVSSDADFTKVVVLCGLPSVTEDKKDKFIGLMRDTLNKVVVESTKEPVKILDLYMPFKTSPVVSKGYIFVYCQKAIHATAIQQKMHGSKFVGNSFYKVYRYDDWENMNSTTSTTLVTPERQFVEPVALQSWLCSEESLDGKDQFVVRFDGTSEVYWHSNGNLSLEVKKPWTENIDWSPRGTYMVNFAPLGIALYGGPNWTQVQVFMRQHVMAVQFSPCERFMFTWSHKFVSTETPEAPQSIVLWDVKSGRQLRNFHTVPNANQGWEFSWSHDGRFFSRLVQGLIYVYETETLSLIKDESGQKKPIKLYGPTASHAWSPTDPYLAVFVQPAGTTNNIPARIILMEMPTRRTMGQVSMINVVRCYIHWQEPAGNYLAVRIDRQIGKNKKREKTSTAFEFFRVRDKHIPVESLELKENVFAFDWEPCGNRFAIIHADSPNGTRANVSFYSMEGGKLKPLKTLEKKQASHLYWSPAGRYIVLAGLRSYMNHQLEFFDAQEMESYAQTQHSHCTMVSWDPTGRYFASYVLHERCKSENGFRLWSYRGAELYCLNKDTLHQFLWRPRPPTSLSPEKIAWLKEEKNFKSFQETYRKKDLIQEAERAKKEEALREEKRQQYRSWQAEKKAQWKKDAEWRRSLGIVDEDDEDVYIVQECVEEVLSTEAQILD